VSVFGQRRHNTGVNLINPAEPATLLLESLRRAGLPDVVAVEPVAGGFAALAGIAVRRDAPPVFVKTFEDPPAGDGVAGEVLAGEVFLAEAEGLAALRELGGVLTPEVLLADRDLLVLEMLRPRPDGEDFWEELAHAVAGLHRRTAHPRFGWHRDNWLGRRRQVNTWQDDGFEFFAQHRLLRWLGEPRVDAALDAADRAALERLCHRLPELLPHRPACLTHGDFWASNVLATPDGRPALIDPAVSYTWAEVDLAHVWSTAPPPEAARFFAVYAELAELDDGWPARMPIIQLRQHLAVVAQLDYDWGAADLIRATLAPFRTGRPARPSRPAAGGTA
jgi:fructosamine-3-kinase